MNDSLQNVTITSLPTSSSIDYGILQGSATLLAGLIIFLTLQKRPYRLYYYTQQSETSPRRFKLDAEGLVLLSTLVPLCFTIAFALFSETILHTKISFVVSLVPLVAFIVLRLHSYSPQEEVEPLHQSASNTIQGS
jgi:hypothetical protein